MVSESCQEVLIVAKRRENKVQLVIGWSIHSSSSDGVDFDALWLALLNEVRQLAAHALNCLVSDYNGVECIEIVVGQAYERV